MVEGKRVAVVVPAYDEALLVAETIRGIPDFVDLVVVVDDCSTDDTAEQARATGPTSDASSSGSIWLSAAITQVTSTPRSRQRA